ncbi:MAG: hypothetical protein QM753_05825 [Thermomicrobiales bacterium]
MRYTYIFLIDEDGNYVVDDQGRYVIAGSCKAAVLSGRTKNA